MVYLKSNLALIFILFLSNVLQKVNFVWKSLLSIVMNCTCLRSRHFPYSKSFFRPPDISAGDPLRVIYSRRFGTILLQFFLFKISNFIPPPRLTSCLTPAGGSNPAGQLPEVSQTCGATLFPNIT